MAEPTALNKLLGHWAKLAPDFLWPQMLWFLLLLPALVLLYVWLMRRQARRALAYPQLALIG